MRVLRIFCLACTAGVLSFFGETTVFQNPVAFAATLNHLADTLSAQNALSVASSLPAEWVVRANQQTFVVSTSTLRDLLTARAPKVNRVWPKVIEAKLWLRACSRHVESFTAAPTKANASAKLRRILTRPEFSAAMQKESAWDRWKREFYSWIVHTLTTIFGAAFFHSGGADYLLWTFIIGGIGLSAYLLIRFWRSMERPFQVGAFEPGRASSSEHWLIATRAASEMGDLRRAIQCAYWAAVYRLQETSVLPREATRTPREYLHVLDQARRDDSHQGDVLEPMRTLTRDLEIFWYGGSAPSQDDFAVCLRSLEALGCKLA